MNETKALPRNVSMYPRQWDLVEEVSEKHGFNNTSTALRYIIEQFRRNAAEQTQEENREPVSVS